MTIEELDTLARQYDAALVEVAFSRGPAQCGILRYTGGIVLIDPELPLSEPIELTAELVTDITDLETDQ